MDSFVIAARVVLGTLFAYSAWTKVRGRVHFSAFSASLTALGLVSGRRAKPVAATVAAAEAATAVLLALDATQRAGLVLAPLLLVSFAAAIVIVMRRHLQVPCHCLGASSLPLGRPHLVRNVVLATVAVIAAVGAPADALPVRILAVVVAVSVAVVLHVIWLDDIVAVLPPRRAPRSTERSARA